MLVLPPRDLPELRYSAIDSWVTSPRNTRSASISRSDMSMLIVGAVLVSLLAIFADLLLQWLQRTLTPKGLLK